MFYIWFREYKTVKFTLVLVIDRFIINTTAKSNNPITIGVAESVGIYRLAPVKRMKNIITGMMIIFFKRLDPLVNISTAAVPPQITHGIMAGNV